MAESQTISAAAPAAIASQSAKSSLEHIALGYLAAIVFSIGILTLPAVMYNVGDPYAWREEARSLILHGSLDIDPNLAENFPSKGAFFVLNRENGKWYSRYGSFNGLLNIIPLLAEKLVTGQLPPLESPTRVVFLGVFFAALSVAIACVLYLVTGYYTENIGARVAFVLLAFYTTYLWNYLRSTTQESTHLLLLASCYLFSCASRRGLSRRRNVRRAICMRHG